MADRELITLGKSGTAELTEKKSVFIAHASPISSEVEALEFIASVKKKYSDCRHCVYAYMLSENSIMRYTDDGEPQGTAGLPVLDVIRKGGFDNAVITVTRYFGGILLGTGGLVRAYSSAASLAVKDAGLVVFKPHNIYSLSLSYQDYAKITRYLETLNILSTDFESDVNLKIAIPVPDSDNFIKSITELTSGKSIPVKVGFELIKTDINQ